MSILKKMHQILDEKAKNSKLNLRNSNETHKKDLF